MTPDLSLYFVAGLTIGMVAVGPVASALIIDWLETRRWRKALPAIMEWERQQAARRREQEAWLRELIARKKR